VTCHGNGTLYEIQWHTHTHTHARTHTPVRTKGHVDCLKKRVIEIQLHPDNFNTDGRVMLSRAWQPILKQLRNSTANQWDHRNLRTPPTAPIGSPGHPWVHKQCKWHTELYNYLDDGNGVSFRNVVFYKSPDVAVCTRKLHWVLSPWKFQDVCAYLVCLGKNRLRMLDNRILIASERKRK
jgi:hypothetical protein